MRHNQPKIQLAHSGLNELTLSWDEIPPAERGLAINLGISFLISMFSKSPRFFVFLASASSFYYMAQSKPKQDELVESYHKILMQQTSGSIALLNQESQVELEDILNRLAPGKPRPTAYARLHNACISYTEITPVIKSMKDSIHVFFKSGLKSTKEVGYHEASVPTDTRLSR